jgi:hydrogenase maturation factor HypF (carbamoyltransferase family)
MKTLKFIISKNLIKTDLTIPADRALYKTYLSELFDSSNKRFLYPFIDRIVCGPRASFIHKAH